MEPKERFSQLLNKYKDDPEYIAEGLIIDITEQIVERLSTQKVTRTQLANRLKCSNAYITKLLDGTQNLTVKKLVEIAVALGCSIDFALVADELEVYRMFKYKKPERMEFNEEVPTLCAENCEPNISIAA
jgi:transcriptional regulator with XRE-family HTH domain